MRPSPFTTRPKSGLIPFRLPTPRLYAAGPRPGSGQRNKCERDTASDSSIRGPAQKRPEQHASQHPQVPRKGKIKIGPLPEAPAARAADNSSAAFMQKEPCAIGLIGLAVMGQNLVLNMNDHGHRVAVFNRTVSKVDDFIKDEAAGTQVTGAHSIPELINALKKPRRVMLMVKAGDTVDQMIDTIVPHLEPGDIVIDGGNSHYPDTTRRTRALAEKGILFVGTGVSGGEEGARHGPSIMPGGNPAAWPHVKEIFQAIAAKVEDGSPCCDWVGEEGAGHYVKMVHNGIEYGDMQLICEAYQLLRDGLGLNMDELNAVFGEWNN